jgi:hypothetical protein
MMALEVQILSAKLQFSLYHIRIESASFGGHVMRVSAAAEKVD